MTKKHPDEVFEDIVALVTDNGYGLHLDTKIILLNFGEVVSKNTIHPPKYIYQGVK